MRSRITIAVIAAALCILLRDPLLMAGVLLLALIAVIIVDITEKRRSEKQPLDVPSAGSTFKRPTGFFAGKLIEDAGLKGFQVGGAQISPKHAGFVVNTGTATCEDVLTLINHVKDIIYSQNHVNLEPEILIVGEE